MDTEAFIIAIQDRPALWMSVHPQHKFRNVVKRLWEEMKELFPDVPDIKKKWKSLKDMYRKELKKVLIPRSGDVAITDVEVRWKYFKLLSYLRDEMIPTDGDGNLEPRDDNLTEESNNGTLDPITEQSNFKEQNPNVTQWNLEQQDLNTTRTNPEQKNVSILLLSEKSTQTTQITQPTIQSDQLILSPSPSTSTNNSERARKRQTPNELRTEYLEIERKKLRMMELELSRNNNLQQEKKSDDYHFLMSILPHIEGLPPIQKMRLRNKINKLLLKEMEIVAFGDQYG